MKHDVVVPGAGESVSEVFIGAWHKKSGDPIKKDEVLVEIETQKATFELTAEYSGRLEILQPNRDTVVKPGDVIATVDDSTAEQTGADSPPSQPQGNASPKEPILSPAARKIAEEKNVDISSLKGTGKSGRLTKEDVLKATMAPPQTMPLTPATITVDSNRNERRQPATRIRRQIAQNLVAAQRTAAILTTFNEVDMLQVVDFRKRRKESLIQKYGAAPGFVSFFGLACIRALKEFSIVNSTFTGEDIITRDFVDLSIAMSTERGLVVPVIRDAHKLSIIEIEKQVAELAERGRAGRLSIQEMTGGTFTITNGGVFGSLLSTPILNMPQSAILGMHKIQDRPMAIEGKVVIRPMMYLALSYDHRLIDGHEAVRFLVTIKEGIENLSLILKEENL